MKKLELKNLKVKALSKENLMKVKGGDEAKTNIKTSGHCNSISYWPVECSWSSM